MNHDVTPPTTTVTTTVTTTITSATTDTPSTEYSTAEQQFRAMGTSVSVIVVGGEQPAALAQQAQARIEELEQRWSRFIPTSDVSRLNHAAGVAVEVSADTLELVRTAIDAWRISGGSVDCTELTALINAGYDRSFDQLAERDSNDSDVADPRSERRHTVSLIGPADIEINGSLVTLPIGVGFDPGGIGKGLAADLVSAETLAAGAKGVCINVGGDLRVRGVGPTGEGWTFSIDHPHGAEPINLVGLFEGAIASSTILRRTWMVDGERRHHLIDPSTGRSSDSDIEFSTVITDEGWRAETLTKAVLLRGGPHPFDLIEGTDSVALAVRRDGTISTSSGWLAFTGGVEPTLTRVAPDTPASAENSETTVETKKEAK